MALIFGVDSKTPANTTLTNGYNLYEWVMRMSCFPSFWGRNINGINSLSAEEIIFLKKKRCKIACMFTDFTEAEISGNSGFKEGIKAVEAAKRLSIPQNLNIALFAEIPSHWSVNHNWMISFAKVLIDNGYVPGFIGNTDSSDNFNFGRQCSHYVQAKDFTSRYVTLYWSAAPKYDFDPDIWASYAPSQLLPHDMHLWQYGSIAFHKIIANKNYMLDKITLKYFL